MVSLFSFFSSKKRPKAGSSPAEKSESRRHPSPGSPKRVRSTCSTSKSASARFKADAARRVSSDGLSSGAGSKRLTTKSGGLASATNNNNNAGTGGFGTAGAPASASSAKAPPPRIDISLPFEGAQAASKFDVSLGLDGVGRTPVLSATERRALDAQRFSPADLEAAWEWLGPELTARGAESVGIMLPRRLETSKDRQRQLTSLFLLARRPELAGQFPSLTSLYPTVPADQAAEQWKARLIGVAKDTSNPIDIAEVLKTVLRRLAPNARPIIDPTTYIRFVQQEHAASYPRVAYANMLVPHLSSDVAGLLNALFEVVAAIALHAERNAMNAGRLCHLFGWWLLGSMPDGTTTWSDLYAAYKLAGQRAEHLFYARVRWQTTQQKMPRRLVQLILSYPFGESSASSEHLPLPPASTFPRKVLHVTLGTNSPLPTGTDPGKVLSDAAIAKLDQGVTATEWTSLRQDGKVALDDLLSSDSLLFLDELASAQGIELATPPATPSPPPEEEPPYGSLGRRRSMSMDVLSSPESPHPETPKRNVVRQSSAANLRTPKGSPKWDDFEKTGFGDTGREFSLSLTKPVTPLRMTPPPVAPTRLQLPAKQRVISGSKATTTSVVLSEVIEDMDDGFIHFVEDGQLDPAASSNWPNFALVQLARPLASTLDTAEPVDWLLVTVKKREQKRPPSLDEPLPNLRTFDPMPSMSSPNGGAESSHSRRFTSTFGFTSLASKFRRKSYMGDFTQTVAPRSKSLQGIANNSREGTKHVSQLSDASDAPTEYTVGEMGEIVKIPSRPSVSDEQPESPKVTIDPVLARTASSDWTYLGEGGAHVVFRYRGSEPSLRGRALRFVKLSTTADTPAVTLRQTWADEVLPQLMSADVLAAPKPAHVDKEWTRAIVTTNELMRPAERRNEGGALADTIDYARPVQLMDDLTCALPGEKVLAIEIKPKWGFLPQARHLSPPESIPIKTRNCRFCLHQHYRGDAPEGAVSYCPLDLYSGDRTRVRHALEGLWSAWHASMGDKNNLRVIVDGKKVLPSSPELIPTSREGSLAQGTADFIIPLLEKSGVLQRLQQLQSTLDATNISELARRFAAQNPGTAIFSPDMITEPSAAEITDFVKLYLADPNAGSVDPGAWTLRQREIAFMLSAIFKDCSMIVRAVVKRDGDAYVLDEDKSSVNIIDTDLKPLTNLQKWYQLDEKLWRHWMETKGSEERTVVIPAEPKESPHHSYHNLSKLAEGAAAGAAGAGVVAAAASAGAGSSPVKTEKSALSPASSFASLDAANTALARALTPSKSGSGAATEAAPAPTQADESPKLEPEIRTALARFDDDALAPEETHAPPPAVPEIAAKDAQTPADTAVTPASGVLVDVPAPATESPVVVSAAAEDVGGSEARAVGDTATPESAESEPAPTQDRAQDAVPQTLDRDLLSEAPAAEAPTETPADVDVPVTTAAGASVYETPVEPPTEAPLAQPLAQEAATEAPLAQKASPAQEAATDAPLAQEAATQAPMAQEATIEEVDTAPTATPAAPEVASRETSVAPESVTGSTASTPADKKTELAGLGVGAGVATAAAATAGAATSATSPVSKTATPSASPIKLKGVDTEVQPESTPRPRKGRISSLFSNRKSSMAKDKDAPTPKTSEIKPSPAKPAPPPKSPKREKSAEGGFASRFRKGKKGTAAATAGAAAAGAATAAAVSAGKRDDAKVDTDTKSLKEEEVASPTSTQAAEVAQTAKPEPGVEAETKPEPTPEAAPETATAVAEPSSAPVQAAEDAHVAERDNAAHADAPHSGAPAETPDIFATPATELDHFAAMRTTEQPAADATPAENVQAENPPTTEVVEDSSRATEPATTLAASEDRSTANAEPAPVETAPAQDVSETHIASAVEPNTAAPESTDAPEIISAMAAHTNGDKTPPTHADETTVADSPAVPIRETFSSLEGTPVLPSTPETTQHGYNDAQQSGRRLSAFGGDQPKPDAAQSPHSDASPTSAPTKDAESPSESPLRKADTAFPRLSAFLDKDAPGIEGLKHVDDSPEVPTPIREEHSAQPSPAVASFSESAAAPAHAEPFGLGIKTSMDPAPVDSSATPSSAASGLAAPARVSEGNDSDSSTLAPFSESRLKRSGAPSPSPHLSAAGAASDIPYEADLSSVTEASIEPAAEESQVLAASPSVESELTAPVRDEPDNMARYQNAELPPLPESTRAAYRDSDMESVSQASEMFVTPFASVPVTPAMIARDKVDAAAESVVAEPSHQPTPPMMHVASMPTSTSFASSALSDSVSRAHDVEDAPAPAPDEDDSTPMGDTPATPTRATQFGLTPSPTTAKPDAPVTDDHPALIAKSAGPESS